MLGIWWIALRDNADRVVNTAVPVAAILVLLDPIIPIPMTLTAIIMVLVVIVLIVRTDRPMTTSAAQAGHPARQYRVTVHPTIIVPLVGQCAPPVKAKDLS